MPQCIADDWSISVQIMVWCHHAPSHYLRQCWPSFMTPLDHNNWIVKCQFSSMMNKLFLTHWGWVTHICINKLTIIGSDNGLSPGRLRAIIWANAGLLLIGSLGTKISEILIEVHTSLFKKIYLKMSSAKWRPFCLYLNVLFCYSTIDMLVCGVCVLCTVWKTLILCSRKTLPC